MASYHSDIRQSIIDLLLNLHLPKEVTLDNTEVLELKVQKSHYSLVFVKKLLFRIVKKSDQYILQFPKEYENLFPEKELSKSKWIEVHLKGIDEIFSLKDNIKKIFDSELNKMHGDPFGCCSKYVKCSDARKCVHEDFLLSLCCQYRLNLLENRIFYGKNKNYNGS